MKKIKTIVCACFLVALVSGCSSEKPATQGKSLDEQMKIVMETQADNYVSNMHLSEDEAYARFNLQKDDIEEIKADIPMMSAHVDTMLIVRAKEGKVDSVKASVEAYRQSQLADTLQYPANIPVIQASIIKVNNNDVYFIMLGNHSNEFMDKDEATQIKELQAQNEEVYNKLI